MIQLSTEQINRAFLNAVEFLDPVIRDASLNVPRIWVNLLPRATMELGKGLVRTKTRFYADIVDQSGLTNWKQIQKGRAPGTLGVDDPGYDACSYEADMISYAFEQVNWTGYQTNKRTPDICINDIKWNWEFEQQLALIFTQLTDTTLNVWNNFGREMYQTVANAEGGNYVLTRGTPDRAKFTVDPMTSTSLTVPKAGGITGLGWRSLRWFHQMLSLQCPQFASKQMNGKPIFPLVINPVDWDEMFRSDPELRQDVRWGRPEILLDGYGQAEVFEGVAPLFDMIGPRYTITAEGATTMTLTRVDPYDKTAVTPIGTKPVVSTTYLNAPYGMAFFLLKDAMTIRIPPAGPAKPGGANGPQFGMTPSLNGEFKWINIPDRKNNILNEKGFYFGRFQGFVEPGLAAPFVCCFLYKRNTQVDVITMPPLVTAEATAVGTHVAVVGTPTYSADYKTIVVTLASRLTAYAPAAVTLQGSNSAEITNSGNAFIVDDTQAPTYTIVTDTGHSDISNLTGGFVLVG